MTTAADIEDKTQKHPVTPCEVLPARELLADMLLEMNQPEKALVAYEADLKKHPNRFNGLYGAGIAAEKLKNDDKAKAYYQQLINISNSAHASRPEIQHARKYLKIQKA
jgi:tetratricopeptide (TPR) repeat protein